MSELINAANAVGQTIAFTRMLFTFCLACSFCSVGGFIIKKSKKENAKNAYYVGGMVISIASCAALVSYLIFARTREVRGMGAAKALNAATGGLIKISWS